MAAVTETLSSYRTQARRLLKDTTLPGTWATDDLNDWVNRSVRQRDLDLGLNRITFSYPMVATQTDYDLAVITAGTRLRGPVNVTPVDLIVVTVSASGSLTQGPRYPLSRQPYSRVSALLLQSSLGYPSMYAMHGPTTVVVAQPPAYAYETEWDFFGYAPALVNDSDADPMPYPWTEPVPYLVARYAKIQAQRYDEADKLEQAYMKSLARVRARGRPMAVTNPWFDLPRGIR